MVHPRVALCAAEHVGRRLVLATRAAAVYWGGLLVIRLRRRRESRSAVSAPSHRAHRSALRACVRPCSGLGRLGMDAHAGEDQRAPQFNVLGASIAWRPLCLRLQWWWRRRRRQGCRQRARHRRRRRRGGRRRRAHRSRSHGAVRRGCETQAPPDTWRLQRRVHRQIQQKHHQRQRGRCGGARPQREAEHDDAVVESELNQVWSFLQFPTPDAANMAQAQINSRLQSAPAPAPAPPLNPRADFLKSMQGSGRKRRGGGAGEACISRNQSCAAQLSPKFRRGKLP